MKKQCKQILAAGIVFGLSLSLSAHDAMPERPRSIDVVGRGSATAPLDMATVTVGAEAESPRTADAQKNVEKKIAAARKALLDLKIKESDIRTTNYDVAPKIVYRENKGPFKDGYRVSSTLSVKVRDLKILGQVFDSMLAAGVDNVQGSSFGVANREAFESEARKKAAQDARRRAEELAQELGVKVGEPMSISEETTDMPQPMPFRAMMSAKMDAGGEAFPVSPGETEINMIVRVSFAIK